MARLVAGCALGLAVVLAGTPARAGDDDAPDVKFLRSLLEGIGLERGDVNAGISYHERSPLVIPPDRSLPAPGTAADANPNWPVDPEVKREKALKAARRTALAGSSSEQFEIDSMPLRPGELEKGRHANSSRDARAMSPEESASPFSPSKLGYKGGFFDTFFGGKDKNEKTARFTGEPPRASLTDPPAGYQTPSPNQPYALGKEIFHPKAEDYLIHHGDEVR